VRRQLDSASRRDTRYLRQIREAGLFTVRDLSNQWQVSEATVLRRVKLAGLLTRKWGRYWVFEPQAITAFEGREWEKTPHLRQIARAGLLTVRDLAERWQVTPVTVRQWMKLAGLLTHKWGWLWVFESQIVEVLEASWCKQKSIKGDEL
jgi:DeoR/GlpR family transcriptional regulator of sugar metabolism